MMKKKVKLPIRIKKVNSDSPMSIYWLNEIPPDFLDFNGTQLGQRGLQEDNKVTGYLNKEIVTDSLENQEYENLYQPTYCDMPKKRVRMDPLMQQGIGELDYDLDTEDEKWLKEQYFKLSHDDFEKMMAVLERGVESRIVTIHNANKLLNADSVSNAVYQYWLHKRLDAGRLTPTVKCGDLPGFEPRNQYIAFRSELNNVQARKFTRKVDAVTYLNLLMVRRYLVRTLTMLKKVKQREQLKRQTIKLTLNCIKRQYELRDLIHDDVEYRMLYTMAFLPFCLLCPPFVTQRQIDHRLDATSTTESSPLPNSSQQNEIIKYSESIENLYNNLKFEEENPYAFEPISDCNYQNMVTAKEEIDTHGFKQKSGFIRRVTRGGRVSINPLRYTGTRPCQDDLWRSLDYKIIASSARECSI